MNKDIKLLGYPLSILDDAILRKIRSGLENEPQLLLQVDTPKVSQKAISNALNSTPGWSTDGATTHDSAGNGIYCLASWGCRITVDTYQHQFRFRILHLDRFGKRDVYAIPLNRVTPPKELPGLSISSDDIKLIFAIADATAGFSNYQERLLTVKHPLQDTVKAHTSCCAFGAVDVNALAALFKGQPDLIAAVAACSDVQLRALKRCRHAPLGLYNFVVPNKQTSIDSWMESVLRPLTFTTDAESNTTGPIIISDSGSSAVTAWANCRGHLAVINSGGMSASNILVNQIQEHIRQCKCQGYTPAPFVVPPITVTSSALCRPEAVDIVLNEKNTPLSTRQSDLLRTAMCSVFRDRAFVSEVYSRWRITMNGPVAYRLDSFRVWRQTIMDCLCKRWFNNDQEIAELFVEEETRQARLANERLCHLSNALAQLADTERFADQICAKPKSVDEAKAFLSEQAFAFWHTPKNGDDCGTKFLVFSVASLSRFIAQAALGRVALKRVVIDEAHILPEAKHSFRPAYNEIGEFIRSRSSRPQIIALTATATPKSRQQIKTDLGMKQDTATFVYSIRRKNLEIQIKLIKANKKAAMSESDVMLRAVEDILRQWDQKGSAIIYGTTVEQVNTAKKFLKGRGFDLKKVTGKMKCKKRRKNQDAFMHGRVSIMVATNAFGLGVDKPDVRLVIHMGLPLTLEGYVQEIGRAGRDGKKSTCVLLYTQSDYKRNKRILKAGGEEAFQWFEQGMKAMHGFADDKTTCAWKKIEKYFGEKPSKRCRVCSNCIAKKLIG